MCRRTFNLTQEDGKIEKDVIPGIVSVEAAPGKQINKTEDRNIADGSGLSHCALSEILRLCARFLPTEHSWPPKV